MVSKDEVDLIGLGRASGTELTVFCGEAVAQALDTARARATDIDSVVLCGPYEALAGSALHRGMCPILRLDAASAVHLGAHHVRAGLAERLLVLGVSALGGILADACALVLADPWSHSHGDGVVCLAATLQSRRWPAALTLNSTWTHDVVASPDALRVLDEEAQLVALRGGMRHALDPRQHGVALHGALAAKLLASEGGGGAALTCIEPGAGAWSYSISLLRRSPE